MADAPTPRQLEVLRFVGDFVRSHRWLAYSWLAVAAWCASGSARDGVK